MIPYKLDFNHPFECILEGGGGLYEVFVHFGVVVCTAANSIQNIFIPNMPAGVMKRDAEEKADIHNRLGVPGKGVVYLDIELKNKDEFLDPYKDLLWEDALNNINLWDYLDTNFPRQDRENYFGENTINIMKSVLFSPLINISFPIKKVSINFLAIGDLAEMEVDDRFNFIVDNHKWVAIAYINPNSTPKVEQILDSDYIFNFPFYYKNDLKEDFITLV